MDVLIRPTAGAAVKVAAALIDETLRRKPEAVLGLATGRTMEALYAELVRRHREEGLDFSRAGSFNLDEYVGLSGENVNSYRYYMNFHLFDHVNIDKRRTRVPDGMTADEAAEGARYEEEIRLAGGIDLQLLGIGRDGHVGFNEPLSSLASRTRSVSLTPETMAQNQPLFDRPEEMPRRALTMGVGTILEARRLLMLVTGEEKAEILAAAVEGPVSAMVSASALQLHPDAVVVADEAAAARLKTAGYCRWMFENDPRWARFRAL